MVTEMGILVHHNHDNYDQSVLLGYSLINVAWRQFTNVNSWYSVSDRNGNLSKA